MDWAKIREAAALRDSGDPSHASLLLREELASARDIESQGAILLHLARCEALMGRFETAQSLLDTAEELKPPINDFGLFIDYLRACFLSSARKTSQAAEAFRKVLAGYSERLVRPDNAALLNEIQLGLSSELLSLGDYRKAIAILDRVESKDLDVSDKQLLALYSGIGKLGLEKYDEARMLLVSAISLRANSRAALEAKYYLGRVALATNDLEAALEAFTECKQKGDSMLPFDDVDALIASIMSRRKRTI